ncbi:hypothetical protein FACS1894110_12810 [Spirochaetia bacterium]|nr:hypothetical protein FACS1894110_12810 [Spirochaetia bacterium]
MLNGYMPKKSFLCAIVLLLAATAVFGQASALRDYVGIIKGTYHPDALEFFDKLKENYKKRGKTDLVKWIDGYIKSGVGGTGFVYVAPDGENYVITNYHVVAQTVSLSISFEKLDGAKTTYDRLKVVAADEDIDIAILMFANDARPFKAGLAFMPSPAEEGVDVFAAGFPGMFNEQIWQFSKGVVSNARMRLPHDIEDEEGVNPVRWGPYIQHTSNIDHGNSGGPLLVQQADVTTGYAVAGINTLTLSGYRENTFFAIPADRAFAYITEALKPKDEEAKRHNLDMRLDAFIKSLAKPKAVYSAIADYLSNGCTASNAEYAIMETFSRAPRTVQDAIDNVNNLVGAMNYCVAWLIEDSFRGKTASVLRATLGDITRNTDGSYTVPLIFSGDRVIATTWVSEFGIWKLDKAGDLVSGDKTLVEKNEKQRERDKKKNDYDNFVMLSVGYTNIFDHKIGEVRIPAANWYDNDTFEPITGVAPAFDALVLIAWNKYGLVPFSFTLAKEFWQIDWGVGFNIPINIKAVTLAPYAAIGIDIRRYNDNKISTFLFGLEFGAVAQGGLMLTTTWVPGLYVLAGYQYNLSFSTLLANTKPTDAHMLRINVGYAFAF